jgi:hypothetical protein
MPPLSARHPAPAENQFLIVHVFEKSHFIFGYQRGDLLLEHLRVQPKPQPAVTPHAASGIR